MSTISFEGRVAIVTGAGRAIGRSYAVDIARRGGAVVVNDVGGQGVAGGSWAEQVAEEIRQAGGKAVASVDSVMTPEGGEAIVRSAIDAFGRVDVVINNAGFLRPAMFEDVTVDQLRDIVDVHLLSGFYVTQPAWRLMKAQGYGRVVFTSSSASFGNEAGTNYAAAKAGLLGLTAALATEGRHCGVKVNAVLPYAISEINKENPIMGSDSVRNRAALEAMSSRRDPASIAPLVTYLSSEDCGANGQAFSALAGRYARVALMLGQGWIADTSAVAEDIRSHFGELADLTGAIAPATMNEELEFTLGQLRERSLV